MTSKRTEFSFIVCVSHEAYPASLEVRKIYRVVQDAAATARQMIRVIDESGEDYLYPQHYFAAIRLSKPLVEALALAA